MNSGFPSDELDDEELDKWYEEQLQLLEDEIYFENWLDEELEEGEEEEEDD